MTASRFLIVRLGSLGDIVHALPAVAAIREAFPRARIDWVVDAKHRELLDLVPIVDRRLVLDPVRGSALRGVLAAVAEMRRARYDVAVDLQGLLRSAVLARASGAGRVLGFGIWHLRERAARPFYTETRSPGDARHVIEKNLDLVRALGITPSGITFPLAVPVSPALERARAQLGEGGSGRFALLNPGAAWPNKRWPPARFGELAAVIQKRERMPSLVLWGPGEEDLARQVVAAAGGAATIAPETTVGDVLAISRAAAVMISGDTGPLHLAGAMGTPLVGLFGPTDPDRNGPWAADDVTLSRYGRCRCHYKRQCVFASHAGGDWCLGDVTVEEAAAAVTRRLQLQ